MEFLNNFVLPQSAEHLELLHYMLLIVLFLFIPFISMVFGGIFLSVFYKRKAKKNHDTNYLRLAKDIIDITTISKSVGVILGIVPVLTCVLIYSQLLHNSEVTNLNYLVFALVLISISLFLIYSYRYSLTFNKIFSSFEKSTSSSHDLVDDVTKLRDESNRVSKRAGIYGLIFLFFGIWFFITGITIPSLINSWESESFIGGLFCWTVVSRFIYYILFAVAISGGMVIFSFLQDEKNKKNIDEKYSGFIKKEITKVIFISVFMIPFFALVNLFGLPESSLTSTVFVYAISSLVLLFIGYHFLYLLTKEMQGTTAALLFFILILSVAANIVGEQKAMETSTKVHSAVISASFEKYLAELKGEGKTVEINAAEMYQVKCSSCHKWDEKLVGPAHKDVIPKYAGKEAQLVAFIRNPSKIDAAFPQMPNPGLKPNEAQAIAKYLLETYNQKIK